MSKQGHGTATSCVRGGRHLGTLEEANAYLADLSCYPNLANWLAREAREDEERMLKGYGKKKTKLIIQSNNSMVVDEDAQESNNFHKDGVLKSEAAADQQQTVVAEGGPNLGKYAILEYESAVIQEHHVDDNGKEEIGNASSFGDRTKPTGESNVLEESAVVVNDLCFSCLSKVEAAIDAQAEAAKMNAEADDLVDVNGKGDAGNASSFGGRTEPAGESNVLEESAVVVNDLCFSCLSKVEAAIDAQAEAAKMNAEADDLVDVNGKGDAGNAYSFGGRTEPAGESNVLEESAVVVNDLCFSCLSKVEAAIDAQAEAAKMNAEADDLVDVNGKGDAGNAYSFGGRTEPAGESNVLEESAVVVNDLCFSCLSKVEAAIDAQAEAAKMNAEADDLVDVNGKGDAGNASSFGGRTEPAGESNVLEESAVVVNDLCFSCLSKVEAAIEAQADEAKMNAEADGLVEVNGKGDAGNASSFEGSTGPTGESNVLEESAVVVNDLCFSCLNKLEAAVDAPAEEAKMNAETEDFIEIMVDDEQAENDADLERMASLQAQPDDRINILPVKILRKRAEKDARQEGSVSLEAQPDDINDIITVNLFRNQAEKDADIERIASLEAQPDDRINIDPVSLLGKQAEKDADLERTTSASLEAQPDHRNDILPVRLLRKQAENYADLERTASTEAQPDHINDIVPVKLLGKQAEKDASLEGMISLEALCTDKKDTIPRKRPRRYFDPEDSSLLTCRRCGEDDHIAADYNIRKKQQKVCCICGRLGHFRQQCVQVNKCLFCNKKGHLANDCPEEEIVREQTSSFCLKCANPGHDMLSCTNDYPADELERIQCYVCKAFGHLCCATYGNEGPKSVSCYNCGESGHLGSECKKLPVKFTEPKHRKGKNRRIKNKKSKVESRRRNQLVHPAVGEKRRLEQECDKSEKGKEVSEPGVGTLSNVPKPVKRRKMKNHVSRPNPPYRFSHGPQSYVPHSYGPRSNPPPGFGYAPPVYFGQNNVTNPQLSWPKWRRGNYPQQQRPLF